MYLKLLLTDEMLLSLQLQYAILLTIVVTIQMKYVLHIIDLRSENPWDNKAVYLLYTELITGNSVTKLLVLLFVTAVIILGLTEIKKLHPHFDQTMPLKRHCLL